MDCDQVILNCFDKIDYSTHVFYQNIISCDDDLLLLSLRLLRLIYFILVNLLGQSIGRVECLIGY
jgi:hypothetical protein